MKERLRLKILRACDEFVGMKNTPVNRGEVASAVTTVLRGAQSTEELPEGEVWAEAVGEGMEVLIHLPYWLEEMLKYDQQSEE